jgi:autotransporter-associated beta strand protein
MIDTKSFLMAIFAQIRLRALVALGVLLLGAIPGRGAVLSWSGLGSSGNWSDSGNWGGVGIPANGDTLVFQSGAARPSNTNNLANLTLVEIRFVGAAGGYAIFGNSFSVTSLLQSTNTAGGNTINNDINVTGATVTVTVSNLVTLNLAGSIGGNAALVKNGAGTLTFSGSTANLYTNTTTVNQGMLQLSKGPLPDLALHGALIIGDGNGPINGDVVRLGAAEQMNDSIPVTINSSGLLDLAGTGEFFGSLAGAGNLVLGSGSPVIGLNGLSTIFDGVISGAGTVYKRGSGTLTLNGNNAYPDTRIEGGSLNFNGFQPNNTVLVAARATLGGSGGVGIVTAVSNAVVAPGSSPGILSCSNLVLLPGSTLNVELNGRLPGLGFDQLSVQGTNNISGAALVLSTGPGFAPLEGEPLVILDNDNVENITGTFSGLSEGSIISVGLLKFRISYIGGTSNDITLTLTNPPAKVVNYQISAGNGNPYVDVNECNNLRLIITNTSGVPLTGITSKLASATPGVDITQPSSAYPAVPAGGTATNAVAFQMATQPSFKCGAPINLVLSLFTDGGGFTIPFTFSSASVSAPIRFNYDISTNILDLTTNDLPIVVSGISNPIVKVTVSLFVTHSFDGDLSFFLRGPNGSSVELSSGNGSLGDDYGAACGVDALRTTFDDSASTLITAGTAPFTNSYRPESPLFAFTGLSGSDVNGTWNLRVIDGAAGDPGNLKCWSLFLTPLNCPDGGGVCSVCANTTISGMIGEGNALAIDRLTRIGSPSSCQAPNGCPGAINHGSTWFEAFSFQNGPSNACINISLSAPTTDLFSAAYLNYFDTNDLCTNYLADSGDSTLTFYPNPAEYSFIAPSNEVFVVVVNSIDGAAGPYQLTVTGGDCRPVLNINRVPLNQVRVDWPAHVSGYVLEGTPALSPTNWSTITNVPVLSGGRYAVTNSIGTNRFFRLRKP